MLAFDNEISFEKGIEPAVALRSFSEPEDGFVWSVGPWCEVIFSFADAKRSPPATVDLVLDLDVFKSPPEMEGQNVLIYLNGLRIASTFVTRRFIQLAPFDPKWLRPSDNVITFDTPDATCPNKVGLNDNRQLGIQLFSLQITRSG